MRKGSVNQRAKDAENNDEKSDAEANNLSDEIKESEEKTNENDATEENSSAEDDANDKNASTDTSDDFEVNKSVKQKIARKENGSESVRKGTKRNETKKNSKNIATKKTKKLGRPAKIEYEVLKIIDDEIRNGVQFYRIRWKGWTAKDDTWEPEKSLSCPDKIKDYENSKNTEYEVEKIFGEKIENGERYFLVKWKGWSEKDNSWVSEQSVDCYELIEKFRNSCRTSKPIKRQSKIEKSPKAKKPRKQSEIVEDTEKEWEVEKILKMRKAKGGKHEYLIRWKGCKSGEDSWEPEDCINCPDLIKQFLKKNNK